MKTLCALAVSLLALALPAHAAKPKADPPNYWVGTWTTSNIAFDGTKTNLGAADKTLREIVHVSLGGPLVRVTLTNEFGTEPLVVGAVHIALAGPEGTLELASANALTFNGKPAITIPAGAVAVSDPAALNLPTNSNLAISLFLPAQPLSLATLHPDAHTTSYVAAGKVVGEKTLSNAAKITSWAFLKEVDVKPLVEAAAVVTLGDSITDGAQSVVDSNGNWPAVLAKRLSEGKKTKNLGVLNAGISGNMLLHNGAGSPAGLDKMPNYGTGLSALSRFDEQVLALPGVQFLIVLEGINDIGHLRDAAQLPAQGAAPTADDLIQGYVQLIERAHGHGIKVFMATLLPYQGAFYATPEGEVMRKAVNAWIRSNKLADGVIDFDNTMRDKSNPDAARVDLMAPDHLHPNNAGYKVMGDSIDLKLFTSKYFLPE